MKRREITGIIVTKGYPLLNIALGRKVISLHRREGTLDNLIRLQQEHRTVAGHGKGSDDKTAMPVECLHGVKSHRFAGCLHHLCIIKFTRLTE